MPDEITMTKEEMAERKRIEKEQQIRRQQELEDVKTIVSSDAGLRFFRRMVIDGRVLTTTFTGDEKTYFMEGARNLVNIYLGDLAMSAPEKFALLFTPNPIRTQQPKGAN